MFKLNLSISEENKEFLQRNWTIGLPIVIQSIIQSSMSLVDSLMIGQLGEESITAVNVVGQIQFLIILLVASLGSGVSIFVGQYFGAKNTKMIHSTLSLGYISSFILGFIMVFFVLLYPSEILSFYTNNDQVLTLGVSYLKIITISFLVFPITLTTSSALKSVGETKLPMFVTVVSLFCNIIFNAIFIIVLDMGIVGAGLGTSIARIIEVVLLVALVKYKDTEIFKGFKLFVKIEKEFIKTYFSKIYYIVIGQLFWSFGTTLYTVSYKYVDLSSQTALYISKSMMGIFQVAGNSLAISCSIVMANILGANEIEKSIQYSRKYMKFAVFVSTIGASLFLLCTPFIITFYDVSDVVINNVYNVSYVFFFLIIIQSFNYTSIVGIIRSGGDTKYNMFLNIITGWCLGIPLTFILAIYTTLPIHLILLFSLGIEEAVKAALSYVRVRGNKWANCLTT